MESLWFGDSVTLMFFLVLSECDEWNVHYACLFIVFSLALFLRMAIMTGFFQLLGSVTAWLCLVSTFQLYGSLP